MKTQEIIGIDVSKLSIDVCIHSTQTVRKFKNCNSGFKLMINWVFKNSKFNKEETLFVFENTGMYSQKITWYLSDYNYSFVIVSGLEIKRTMGIVRGKNDVIDAKRIALFGYRLRDELQPSKIGNQTLIRLKSLLGLRSKIVKQLAGFKATFKEQKSIYKIKDNPLLFESQKRIMNTLKKEIEKIDKQTKQIVTSDEILSKNYKLVTSVKGVGHQSALLFLIYTDDFSKFENWRKFASYCGIAPFPYQSGTSINGKNKVSHLANKKLKTILSMCAITSIQHNPEMKIYYEKRVQEGKNKMSTINIIRNKIIARVFAVVKRQTPYVNTLKFAS